MDATLLVSVSYCYCDEGRTVNICESRQVSDSKPAGLEGLYTVYEKALSYGQMLSPVLCIRKIIVVYLEIYMCRDLHVISSCSDVYYQLR